MSTITDIAAGRTRSLSQIVMLTKMSYSLYGWSWESQHLKLLQPGTLQEFSSLCCSMVCLFADLLCQQVFGCHCRQEMNQVVGNIADAQQ